MIKIYSVRLRKLNNVSVPYGESIRINNTYSDLDDYFDWVSVPYGE